MPDTTDTNGNNADNTGGDNAGDKNGGGDNTGGGTGDNTGGANGGGGDKDTLTREEAEKLAEKAANDALSKHGRDVEKEKQEAVEAYRREQAKKDAEKNQDLETQKKMVEEDLTKKNEELEAEKQKNAELLKENERLKKFEENSTTAAKNRVGDLEKELLKDLEGEDKEERQGLLDAMSDDPFKRAEQLEKLQKSLGKRKSDGDGGYDKNKARAKMAEDAKSMFRKNEDDKKDPLKSWNR